jgi:hypothetical protein
MATDTSSKQRNVLCHDTNILCQWRSKHSFPSAIVRLMGYVDPHIGHMHSMVMADIHTRYKLLWKKSALLATGTDEHGIKVNRGNCRTI